MDGGLLASRMLLTKLSEEKRGLGTPLPVCGHPSHQLFCFLAVPERFGPASHGLKCRTCPHQLPTTIHHRQRFVFLFWKLETFRREIKLFPLEIWVGEGWKAGSLLFILRCLSVSCYKQPVSVPPVRLLNRLPRCWAWFLAMQGLVRGAVWCCLAADSL